MKTLLLIVLSPFIVFACLFTSSVAEARWRHHSPPPPPVVTPPSGLQVGFFMPPSGVPSAYTMKFTDGSFPAGNNAVIFWEAPYNDKQVLAGQSDSLLSSFAIAAKNYSNIILALSEEANCQGSSDPWAIGRNGNTVSSNVQAINHEASIVRQNNPNIVIEQDLNADNCNGTYPNASYIASGVDRIGLDDFTNGSDSWTSLFQPAINNLKGIKPIDILSEGASSNQAAFVQQTIAGVTANGINLVLWFNAGSYAAPASTLSQL